MSIAELGKFPTEAKMFLYLFKGVSKKRNNGRMCNRDTRLAKPEEFTFQALTKNICQTLVLKKLWLAVGSDGMRNNDDAVGPSFLHGLFCFSARHH